jgi:hypothetical protein
MPQKREPSGRTHDPFGAFWQAGLVIAVALCALEAVAQAPVPTKAFENPKFHYAVSLPAGCRHDVGPGTLDAVCSPEFDPEKSATASAASAVVLEVSTEAVADDEGKTPADLAQRYSEPQFKAELPEAVCGESDNARVKIDNVKQVLEDARVVYTADVVCSEIKFLGLGERQAVVQFVITPGLRYRLMARALKEDFEQKKPSIDAFMASFQVTSASK